MNESIEVSSIQKLQLGPDDVLVVSVPRGTFSHVIPQLREAFDKVFAGHYLICMEDDIKLSVISMPNGKVDVTAYSPNDSVTPDVTVLHSMEPL